jgi:DNA-binding IclR family transcriptional regulator
MNVDQRRLDEERSQFLHGAFSQRRSRPSSAEHEVNCSCHWNCYIYQNNKRSATARPYRLALHERVGKAHMPIVTKSLGDGTQSVLLTIAILECLASQKRPVSVSELAKTIGTSKSRVFRHLRTLLVCDYVNQNEMTGHYGIGARLLALCRSTSDRHDLGVIATPFMEGLRERFRHSVIVSRIEPDGVHVIKSISGYASIVLEVRQGTVLSFERSAQGMIALAFAAETLLEDHDAIADVRARFAKTYPGALENIRREGIAAAQMREGLTGVAVPIFDGKGRVTGTLALLNTAAEMNDRRNLTEAALKDAALSVSRQLGFQGADGLTLPD